ncbi:CHAT domain-containing protein [Streptomyces sp. NPDC058001]|uniref:CHAT domain-containing tetratricopeptide repeat protein n=1 Tax=Streptomyces sp. NPDC058001 TaxID=3346300 RepID=UPI0036E5E25B
MGETQGTAGLEGLVRYAQEMMALGRTEYAEVLLQKAARLADARDADPLAVTVYSRLVDCARADERWTDALEYGRLSHDVAARIGSLELVVGTANTLTMVMAESGRIEDAVRMSGQLVELVRPHGNGLPLAVALLGHATALRAAGDDASADRYAEVLDQPGAEDLRGTALSALGQELFRRNRTAEGMDRLRDAAEAYAAAGQEREAYRTRLRLANLCRDRGLAESGPEFAKVHDLALDLFSDVDEAHYRASSNTVRRTEAENGSRFESAIVELTRATATTHLAEGTRLLSEHRHTDAELRLRAAEELLSPIDGYRELTVVWFLLGQLAGQRGDSRGAGELFDRAAAVAAHLGDASGELVYTMYRCMAARPREPEQLERLVRARALLRVARAEIADDTAAMISNLLRDTCEAYGAHELAASYEREAAEQASQHIPSLVPWLAALELTDRTKPGTPEEAELTKRLTALRDGDPSAIGRYAVSRRMGLLEFEQGRFTEETLAALHHACTAFEEMRRNKGETDTFSGYTSVGPPPYEEHAELALHLGRVAEAFTSLERIKSRTVLDALRTAPPPLVTDDSALAMEAELWQELLDLLGYGSARAESGTGSIRIEQLRTELAALWDDLAESHPGLRAHRLAEPVEADELPALLASRDDAVLVEFFAGRHALHAFVASGQTLTAHRLDDVDGTGLDEFTRLLAAESQRSPADPSAVLEHPVHRTLAGWLDRAAAGRPLYVVPHGQLHKAPLHLGVDEAGQPRPRAATQMLPSASLLRATGAARWQPVTGAALVGADPVGDLPYARAEGEHAAARLGVPAAYGQEVTADWLADGLAGLRSPFVHLACHATFNARRPERSGLRLATPGGGTELIGPDRLAAMNWSGAVVVLGACRSGSHEVEQGDELAGLGRALLAAGAAAIVVSRQPVEDLTSALLMTWLHDELTRTTGPVRMGAVLAAAQNRMRCLSARELVDWAVSRRDGAHGPKLASFAVAVAHRAAGEQDGHRTWKAHTAELLLGGPGPSVADWRALPEQADGPGYAARPFARPEHWAWFYVLGT